MRSLKRVKGDIELLAAIVIWSIAKSVGGDAGLAMGLLALALYLWACTAYGMSKGYSWAISFLLGIIFPLGAIVLLCLPSHAKNAKQESND